jgi:hypothetical protein
VLRQNIIITKCTHLSYYHRATPFGPWGLLQPLFFFFFFFLLFFLKKVGSFRCFQ